MEGGRFPGETPALLLVLDRGHQPAAQADPAPLSSGRVGDRREPEAPCIQQRLLPPQGSPSSLLPP